jgi:hypothetical protein
VFNFERNVEKLYRRNCEVNRTLIAVLCILRKFKTKLSVQVSWIRHRDLHILTVGSYTYSSDQRFQTTHHKESGEWTLHIKFAQQRDAGVYECQIPTQPLKSYFVNLNVVGESSRPEKTLIWVTILRFAVPTATILGGPDLHVDKGSTINLTCSIRFSPEPPVYIFWYHHDVVSASFIYHLVSLTLLIPSDFALCKRNLVFLHKSFRTIGQSI